MPDKADLLMKQKIKMQSQQAMQQGKSSSQTYTFWNRVKNRMIEMKDRRRRLIKLQFKKDGRADEYEKGFSHIIQSKRKVLADFESLELETMMKQCTKNTTQEVVQTLFPHNGQYGLLIDLQSCFDISITKSPISPSKKNSPDRSSRGIVNSGETRNKKLLNFASTEKEGKSPQDTSVRDYTHTRETEGSNSKATRLTGSNKASSKQRKIPKFEQKS